MECYWFISRRCFVTETFKATAFLNEHTKYGAAVAQIYCFGHFMNIVLIKPIQIYIILLKILQMMMMDLYKQVIKKHYEIVFFYSASDDAAQTITAENFLNGSEIHGMYQK